MGGGLRKPSPLATYSASDADAKPSPATRGHGAGAVTDEQLDAQEELEAKREEEMAQRQKAAVNHVVENLFPYAPVRVQTQKYPPSSPYAGKAYLWITVDEEEIKRLKAGASPIRYPVGVAIDAEGNVFVSESSSPAMTPTHGMPDSPGARRISAASIMELATTNQAPPPPKAPQLLLATQTSLTVRWKKSPDTTVDRYEVQFRLADSPNNAWSSLAVVFTVRDVALDSIRCHTPVEFRVRAHNPAGWSEYGPVSEVFWTLPGPPSTPQPPVPGALTNTYISLFWSRVENNGAAPVTGHECSVVASDLHPKTPYIFRLKAINSVGETPFVESRPTKTLAHGRPEIVELTSAEQTATYDRWVTCWDPKTEQVFYFNKYTCQRVVDEPPELIAARESKGLTTVEETPEMRFRRKRFRFHRELRQTTLAGLNLSATLAVKLHRESMYEDSVAWFKRLSRQELVGKPRITFENEAGIDSGGLTKDWFLQVSQLAREKKRGLFKECDQGLYEIDSRSMTRIHDFKFLGTLMAKAIFDRQSLDLPLCDAVLKHFLQLKIEMNDLRQMDAQFHKSLVWMLENDIADVIDETFSVEVEGPSGKPSIEDLKENGRDIPVTDANKAEYVDLVLQWRTAYGVQAQLDAMIKGFSQLIPLAALRVFDLDEFRMLINGKPSIDVEELRANTVFQGGYNEHSQVVLWLWQALREFTLEMRGLFLKFMTGTNKIPLDGFEPPLNITKSDLENDALPRTHTCFNQLVLPDYTSYEALVHKVTFAIQNAEGFELS
ncbi:hypothetical protein P43SY_003070 [Pythium insidiosum]|uniref:HECT-type E3 ubiquitin transferase n=1 Tax=Pythium insidiosum TaxID=114742 RepID=A0AAD5LPJ8_PYTIN|nr:hypothetical protein P43SY_003070 [Pythium insidiosum]